MSAPTYDTGSMGLMLNELRLPTIGRLWSDFAQRSDKEGWQASQLLGVLFEHELAERAKRRLERHRVESQLDPTKTLATFDFSIVPMVSKRSEEHTSELQSRQYLVCRLLLEKKKKKEV